jgi:5'-3' exonuclease
VPGPLLAVDTPSMLFRAFYALPTSIEGPDGKPVNALLGATNLILREIEANGPRAVALCFGPDAADYRVELFDGYHADRVDNMPDELAPQFEDAGDFFAAFGWTVSWHDSLEADDLLGSYAQLEADAGGRALLMTGDRDMFQCAGERVQVLYIRTGARGAELVGPDEVRGRYGVGPELVPRVVTSDEVDTPWKPATSTILPSSSAERMRSARTSMSRALVWEVSVTIPAWEPVREMAS